MKSRCKRFLTLSSLLAVLLGPTLGHADPGEMLLHDPADLHPEPPPVVEILEAYSVGPDLAVVVSWSGGGISPAPLGADLQLLDPEGLEAGTTTFTPAYGPQTVWISGGALPRASEVGIWPLIRHLEVVTAPEREIVAETGLALNATGQAQAIESRVRRHHLYNMGRVCILRLVTVKVIDPEDANGDDLQLNIAGIDTLRAPDDVRGGKTLDIYRSYVLCDTCNGIQKTTSLKLIDIDGPFDPNDTLGTIDINGCSPVPQKTVKLSGSNYTHELTYGVSCFDDYCPQ